VDLGHIILWPGKVNNHTTSTGQWEVDPDCTSGAELHDAEYCAKFYPDALYSVQLPVVSPGTKMFYSAGCTIPAPSGGYDEYACVVCVP